MRTASPRVLPEVRHPGKSGKLTPKALPASLWMMPMSLAIFSFLLPISSPACFSMLLSVPVGKSSWGVVRSAAWLCGVFELHMRTDLSNIVPAISLECLDEFRAVHGNTMHVECVWTKGWKRKRGAGLVLRTTCTGRFYVCVTVRAEGNIMRFYPDRRRHGGRASRCKGCTGGAQNTTIHEKAPLTKSLIRQRGLLFPWCPGPDLNRHDPKIEGF